MRIHICAVGRLRAGPESALVQDYISRFDRTGRALALGPITVHEVDERKGGGMAAEAGLLSRSVPQGSVTVALDERGSMLSSPEFATRIAGWRDDGRQDLAFLIGGADGLAPDLRNSADFQLSLGTMVWPHMMVRAMLSEQLYRTASILAGAPYHRA